MFGSSRKKPKRILTLDWDGSDLRIVDASLSKRGVAIEKIISVPIPSQIDAADPAQMGAHIQMALDQEGIATRHAIVDIPRDQAILTTLRLPCSVPEELPGMVAIQIGKELPFPVSEAVIDFAAPVSDGDEAVGDVLTAAVRREVLDRYRETCEAAGLRLERIGLRPYANKVAIYDLLKDDAPERIMFIDVGPTLTEIDVFMGGQLAFSRSASVVIPKDIGAGSRLSISGEAGSDSDEAPAALGSAMPMSVDGAVNMLMMEVTRSIEAYRAKAPGATIDRVIIGGDRGVEQALSEAIDGRLKIQAEIYNPAPAFGWEPDEGAAASAFGACLGLAVGHAADDSLHFDFLHPKKTVSKTEQKLKKAPLVAAIVLLFAGSGVMGFYQYTKKDRDLRADLIAQIEEHKSSEKDREEFIKLVNAVEAFDQSQIIWIDYVYDIIDMIPDQDEFMLTKLEMNLRNREIKLDTRFKSRNTGTKLVAKIKRFRRADSDEPVFSAELRGAAAQKVREEYRFSQEIVVTIKEPLRKPTPPKTGKGAS